MTDIKFSNGSTMTVSNLFVSTAKTGKEEALKATIASASNYSSDNADYVVFQKDNKIFTALGRGDLRAVDPNMSFKFNGEEVKTTGKTYVINDNNTKEELGNSDKSVRNFCIGMGAFGAVLVGSIPVIGNSFGEGIVAAIKATPKGQIIGFAAAGALILGGGIYAQMASGKDKAVNDHVKAPLVAELAQKGIMIPISTNKLP